MGTALKLEDVTFSYQEPSGAAGTVLWDLNLSVAGGEFVAVIGPNGSGKSTLARLLNGLLKPARGRVLVDGAAIGDGTIGEKVGLVFQNPENQLVASIVAEDVAFGPENLALPSAEIDRRVTEALALVDMTAYREHPVHLLSGGQKQRVAIAGVMAIRPQCIILDEPTAMLDPRGRREVLETVQRLNREAGLTVILITHHMEEALLAGRVLVLCAGAVVADDSPAGVFGNPALLRDIGLDATPVAFLAERLREAGFAVPRDIFSVDEMVEWLCPC